MQYIIFVEEGNGQVLYTGPVSESDAAFLRKAADYLKPLSDEQYMTGLAGILHTMARSSYILDGNELYWCIEWEPGLVVVRMTPIGDMQWCALRSPIPNFGGRDPLPEDGDPEDYHFENNSLYNLVFVPWDAQFDEEERESGRFVPASPEVRQQFHDLVTRANELSNLVDSRIDVDNSVWLENCKQNLAEWCGEGIRLRSENHDSGAA